MQWVWAVAIVACGPGDPGGRGTVDSGPSMPPGVGSPTADTAAPPDPCGAVVPATPALSQLAQVSTEEDFDFDGGGLLVSQHMDELVGWDIAGEAHLLTTGASTDPAGLKVLHGGDILLAHPDDGTVRRVDPATGGSRLVLSDLSMPNGLEVGVDGLAYVSEMTGDRVRQFDPDTGDSTPIAQVRLPNGLALSADEQTLYVGSTTEDGRGLLTAVHRDPDGSWGDTTEVMTLDGVPAVTTDVCGNLYLLEFHTGRIWQRTPAGDLTLLTDLPAGLTPSLRFGAGHGGWARTTLYATQRSSIFALDVGLPGRHLHAVLP